MAKNITLNEWIKELDQYRVKKSKIEISPELRKFLIAARENKKPVSFTILAKLIKQHFKIDMGSHTWNKRYQMIKEGKI